MPQPAARRGVRAGWSRRCRDDVALPGASLHVVPRRPHASSGPGSCCSGSACSPTCRTAAGSPAPASRPSLLSRRRVRCCPAVPGGRADGVRLAVRHRRAAGRAERPAQPAITATGLALMIGLALAWYDSDRRGSARPASTPRSRRTPVGDFIVSNVIGSEFTRRSATRWRVRRRQRAGRARALQTDRARRGPDGRRRGRPWDVGRLELHRHRRRARRPPTGAVLDTKSSPGPTTRTSRRRRHHLPRCRWASAPTESPDRRRQPDRGRAGADDPTDLADAGTASDNVLILFTDGSPGVQDRLGAVVARPAGWSTVGTRASSPRSSVSRSTSSAG